MRVTLKNLYSNKPKILAGSDNEIFLQLVHMYPFLQKLEIKDLRSALKRLSRNPFLDIDVEN